MSTSTPKKPTGTGNSSRATPNPPAATATPPRNTTRAAGQEGPATGTPTIGPNRTRSLRNGTPVSARAAVRKAATPDPAEEDAKIEMQARTEELQERLRQAELAHEDSQKHAAVLQVKLDEALKEQGMLEERMHENSERIDDLENEKKESLRSRRELEQIYESERAATIKEREEATSREEELQASMQRLKEALSQREMRAVLDDEPKRPSVSRQSSAGRSANASPINAEAADRQFAPSSLQRSDSASRSNSKLVMQKDKIIESLRLELAEAQIKLVEMENMGGGQLQELQKQVYDIKMQNARLMEENESFQLLLSEKTLNGDFLRPTSNTGSRPPSRTRDGDGGGGGTSLADELDAHADSEGGEDHKRFQAEVNSLKDQNKALTLYINNIISRLLQHEQFEQILDKTPDIMAGPGAASRKFRDRKTEEEKDLPPLPSEDQPTGFLQRARSVVGGRKPRPMSQNLQPGSLLQGEEGTTVHEHPETAPSVPLGRTRSVRTTGGHRRGGSDRVSSDWPTASLVTNMYRGSSGTSQGPLSPGLGSSSQRGSFFPQSPPPGSRQPSGSSVPTINADNKENAVPQRDSKFSAGGPSGRDSVTSNPANVDDNETTPVPAGTRPASTDPASPPRSVASSGDRDAKASGAIMMGSRMRPLRLVQESAAQEDAAKNQAAKRGSWFGWMNKGLSLPKSEEGDVEWLE